jgi:RNA polymerase sigma-70 factor, ECF subfamily
VTRPVVPTLVDDLFRRSAGEISAVLLRRLGGAGLEVVEEAVQEAFVQALRTWSYRGMPDNPRGWLYRVALRRAMDGLARGQRRDRLLATAWSGGAAPPPPVLPDPDRVSDDELALLLLCCHTDLSRIDRVVLTLKVGCGFSVDEIAVAFLTKPAAIAQRLVRAKRKLRAGHRKLPDPTAALLRARGPDLREVVYLLFSGGHAAADGDALVREDLCREALRLARLMLGHTGGEHPATRALAALMCFHGARLPARTDDTGALVPLDAQDRTQWDRALLAEGFHHLERAADGDDLTRYHLEAGIAAAHAAASGPGETDWPGILKLYDALAARHHSPVVALNRAVAVGRVRGPQAGLAAAKEAAGDGRLTRYHLLPAVMGSFLDESGRRAEAAAAFQEAAALAPSVTERRYLEARAARMLDERAGP